MGVTVVTSAGNINVTTARDVLSLAPSGWDDQVAEYGIGYSTPLTGNSFAQYRVGDHLWVEQNIFTDAARSANSLKMHNDLDSADYLTLRNNNSFGNTNRFTDELGGQTFTNKYIVDHITGMGFMNGGLTSTVWNTDVDSSLGTDYGGSNVSLGYTDWFMPNVYQLFSLHQIDGWPIFPLATLSAILSLANDNIISSSTYKLNTNKCFYIPNTGGISQVAKATITGTLGLMYFRKHF